MELFWKAEGEHINRCLSLYFKKLLALFPCTETPLKSLSVHLGSLLMETIFHQKVLKLLGILCTHRLQGVHWKENDTLISSHPVLSLEFYRQGALLLRLMQREQSMGMVID